MYSSFRHVFAVVFFLLSLFATESSLQHQDFLIFSIVLIIYCLSKPLPFGTETTSQGLESK